MSTPTKTHQEMGWKAGILSLWGFFHIIEVTLACKFTASNKNVTALPPPLLHAPSSVIRYVWHTCHSGKSCYTGTSVKCHWCFVGF